MIITVNNLGHAAYAKMFGFKVCSYSKKSISFDIDDDKADEFKNTTVDFMNSSYAKFDSWVMNLKNMPVVFLDSIGKNPNVHLINGLGCSAFLMLNSSKEKWRIVNRVSSTSFAFYVPSCDIGEFESMQVSWINSSERDFDSEIMALKSGRMLR